MEGIMRVAAAVPKLRLCNVAENAAAMAEQLHEAADRKASLVAFPELSLTGYTCGDLFFQKSLLQATEAGLQQMLEACPEGVMAVVGAPVQADGVLYNCAVVLTKGKLLGVVPKLFLPNYNEFYEKRWFASGFQLQAEHVMLCGQQVPMGRELLFESADGVRFGVELCEDLWTALPPSTFLSLHGAELIVNLSASNELIAKREYRQELVRQQSARCLCAYLYVSAGVGESTSDLVFSGHSMVAQCGGMVKENADYLAENYVLTADLDLDRIRGDRREQTSFADAQAHYGTLEPVRRVSCPALMLAESEPVELHVAKHPFIPADKASRQTRCAQIFDMQADCAGASSADHRRQADCGHFRRTGFHAGAAGGLSSHGYDGTATNEHHRRDHALFRHHGSHLSKCFVIDDHAGRCSAGDSHS